ncbi:inner membrane protein YhjD [Amycolatopsis nigrescens]|uniref:inner membrane protein YhjD n=1 Tax=Amycolatopsis nigrescens TaxID=381445 RepID=UPI000378F22D|nr:inner membrane protein YhjD [Amycolatopsis nigrescens]
MNSFAERGKGRWRRLRGRYRWLDHLVRAVDRYVDHHGYHFVGSITYFSLLSLVPVLMVAFSVAGFVLAGQPKVLGELLEWITHAVPGPLGQSVRGLLEHFVEQRTQVGVFGVLIGLYSGWNWMNALRDALTAMWDQNRTGLSLLRTVPKDLLALLGLGAALLVTFALTASSGVLGDYLLRVLELDQTGWGKVAIGVASVPLALFADWLVFLWVLTRLPRDPVGIRSAMRGAVAAAIGFELLKQAGSFYLRLIGDSPTGAAFGSVIGLMVFISLVSRLLVFITAWTATARDAPATALPPPAPVVIRAGPGRHRDPLVPATVGALAGITATLLFHRHRRRE